MDSRWLGRATWMLSAASVAVLVAAPWLRQELVFAGWLGIAAALVLATGRRGWRAEALVLGAATLAIALAFHWTPEVLADALRAKREVGFAFAVPIVLWDACRLALPFWCIGRLVRDPRSAWLPAGLVAVIAEASLPGVFPWKLGYLQLAWPVTVQAADLLGPQAPTLALFAHAGALVTVAGPWLGRSTGRVPALGVAALVVAAANVGYGFVALERVAALEAAAPRLRLALVQVDPESDDATGTLREWTRRACAADPPPALVCWPECSGGSYEEGLASFADEREVFRRSREPQRGLRPWPEPLCRLLLGGKIYRGYPERPSALFQAALLVDETERLVATYHKRHLMPFGEYVPGATLIPELRLHFRMDSDLAVGAAPTVLAAGEARLGALLCYEDMVPGAAASLVASSANLLVSLVNGTSFKNPLTLEQHRLLAQLRAVENRRCLVRCAATGETCVIAPTGAVTRRLPLHAPGVLVAEVPLLEIDPLARRAGPLLPGAAAATMAGWLGLAWRRARGRQPAA